MRRHTKTMMPIDVHKNIIYATTTNYMPMITTQNTSMKNVRTIILFYQDTPIYELEANI